MSHSTLKEIETAIRRLSDATLKETLDLMNKESPHDTKALQKQFLDQVIRHTMQHFVMRLDIQDKASQSTLLQKAIDAADGSDSLPDYVVKLGLQPYVAKLPVTFLNDCCSHYGLQHYAKRQDSEIHFVDELVLNGMQFLLSSLPTILLKTWATQLNLKPVLGKKEEIVDLIMCAIFKLTPVTQPTPEEKKTPKRKETASLATPPLPPRRPTVDELVKGLTYDDIFQRFWKEELDQFCKLNGLPLAKKPVMIRTIVKFLETGERPAGKKGAGKKRKSGAKSGTPKKAKEGDDDNADDDDDDNDDDEDEGDDNDAAAAGTAAVAPGEEQKEPLAAAAAAEESVAPMDE